LYLWGESNTIKLKLMEQKPVKKIDFTPPAKKSRFSNIKRFFTTKPTRKQALAYAVLGVLLIGGSVFGLATLRSTPELVEIEQIEQQQVKEEPPPTEASDLTGIQVDPALAARPVTAVMIENSIDARPQSGLVNAGIVFEAIAEGGITRFLALYQEARPDDIGPIRSARPYYVRWAAGYEASFLHSGGSPEALSLIRSLGVRDLDHGALGEGIASRVSFRYAPHNVYTDFDRIDAKNNEFGYTSSNFEPFERKADEVPVDPTLITARTVNFNISGPQYNTNYTYNPETNLYNRTMAGIAHTDQKTGAQIAPKVVIGLEMSYGINSNGIHSIYGNVGSGKAYIFQDGQATIGTWRKTTDKASLELLDDSGEPIKINAGQTWITAIAAGRTTYGP
jgi:hypothetical protein